MRLLIGLVLLCAAACSAQAQTDSIYQYQGADREAKLIEGAKKEGTLLFYTSMAPSESNRLAQAFEKKYGIKVQVWRNLSETVLQRAVAEARARRHSVDVIETNAPEVEVLAQEGLISEFFSPHVAGLHPHAVPPHKKYISDRVNLFVVAFNTQKVKREEIPQTYEGFADPKWKGQITFMEYPVGATYTIGMNMNYHMKGEAADYMKKIFVDQQPTFVKDVGRRPQRPRGVLTH